jgi:hypothetical protein
MPARLAAPDTILPGIPTVSDPGGMHWQSIRFTGGEWTETTAAAGQPVQQELTVTLTNCNAAYRRELGTLLSPPLLLRLFMTDGSTLLVGTPDFPVYVELTRSGQPGVLKLAVKHTAAEPAKEIKT